MIDFLKTLNIDELLPLIPAISILLVLILVYSVYKFQALLKKGKNLNETHQDQEDDDEKAISIAKKSAQPLVVPSTKKTLINFGKKKETSPKSLPLDGLRDKPLLPPVSAPVASDEDECIGLYKELLASDSEEAIYQNLLSDSEKQTQPAPSLAAPPRPSASQGKSNAERADSALLSEIEQDLAGLEKGFQKTPEPATTKEPLAQNLENVFVLSPEHIVEDNLSDTDKLEEGIYQNLLADDSKEPAQSGISSSEKSSDDLASEALFSQIEQEFLGLGMNLDSPEPAPNDEFAPTTLDNLFDSDIVNQPKTERANKEPSQQPKFSDIPEVNLTDELANDHPLDWQMFASTKPAAPAPKKSERIVNRLNTFQTTLERRFGSFGTEKTGKSHFDQAKDGRSAQPTAKKDIKLTDSEKNALTLLESFLFTANQKRMIH